MRGVSLVPFVCRLLKYVSLLSNLLQIRRMYITIGHIHISTYICTIGIYVCKLP